MTQNRRAWLLLGLGSVALVAIAAVVSLVQSPPQDTLRGTVEIEDGVLVIHNRDSRTWTDLSIRLNSAYVVKHDALRAGEQARIALNHFADSQGTRFNINSTKPQSLYIRADVNARGDTADHGWSFR